MKATEILQEVQFVDENLSPSEARDVVNKVINDQIKFYKLKNLSNWIKDDHCDQDCMLNKVEELKQTRQGFLTLINEAKSKGQGVKLSGNFHLALDSQ